MLDCKNKKYSLWSKFLRLLRLKLIIPMMRIKLPPKVKAIGVAIGLFWAMTPLIGIQMWLVFMTWFIFKKLLNINSSLVLAVAWTWVTNVFTMIPVYYIFYLTGQLLQGNLNNITGYSGLTTIIKDAFMKDMSFWDKWILIFKILLNDWGVSMVIGCIPWAVGSAIIGYRFTLKFEEYRLNKKKVKIN